MPPKDLRNDSSLGSLLVFKQGIMSEQQGLCHAFALCDYLDGIDTGWSVDGLHFLCEKTGAGRVHGEIAQ